MHKNPIQLGGGLSFALACAVLCPIAPASAQQPSLMIATAPLVTPSAGLSYFGTPASPTPPSTRDPLIQEQARALRYNIDDIFSYVRDEVETVPIFGVQEGARGIILNGRGTAFDQAQFMVEALREADAVAATGYNPQYQFGTISVRGANFSSWFNIANSGAASRLLADGGIPASVTNNADGTYTVTMLHVWVTAVVGGTRYAFDPSYKTYAPRASLSWQSSVGYTAADLLGAGGGGTGTTISNFNQAAFRSKLDGYRSSIEAYLATNGVGKRADAIVGTHYIVAHPSTENRRTSLPYVQSTSQTWVGQIPDIFRASFTVALNSTTYGTYFADTVGGSALSFGYSYNPSTNSFSASTSTSTAPQILGSTINGCDEYLGGQPNAAAPAVVTVSINHPYAANSGTYGDRTLTKQLVTQACLDSDIGAFYVTNDWGYVGSGIEDRIKIPASRQRTEPVNKLNMIFGPTLANVAHQYSEYLELARWAQGNTYLLHDLIGVHTLDSVSNALSYAGSTTYDPASSLTMDFEGSVSAISASGSTADDTKGAFTAGFGLPLIEGAVPREEADAVYDMASLSLLTGQATRTNPTDSSAPIYLATPTTWSSVQSNLTGYPAGAISAIQSYISAGYSVLVPKHGDLREPPITVTITGSTVTRTMQLWDGTNINTNGVEFKRSAFFAWHPGTNTIPDSVAMLVYDPRHGRVLKAGVGVSIDSVSGTIRKPETPKAESKDLIRAAVNVDGKSGHLKYSPGPDLVDGVGDFPFSLTLQRAFDQTDAENYGMGIGWKNNWNQMATLSNDGSSVLGAGGAQALGPALVLITTLGDLVQTQDAQHLHAAAQVAAWFADQTTNNAVVITPGLDGERTYYRQANGAFVPAAGDGTKLVQTGAPVAGIINRWLYYPVSFTLTDRDGSIRDYPAQTISAGLDISSPAIASIYSKKALPMDRWSFPNGVVVTTSYFNTVATSDIVGINQVANNLGSSIKMTNYDYGSKADFYQCEQLSGSTWTPVETPPRPATITYATSNGASVTINMDAQSRQVDQPYDPPFTCTQDVGGKRGGQLITVDGTSAGISTSTISSYANSVVDANGKTWVYNSHGYVTGLYGGYNSLTQIFKPTDSATPDVALTYGGDYNARSLTDTAGNIWNYYTNPFRSEIVSPLEGQAAGAAGSVTQYDKYGQDVASIDALGRSTTVAYDDLGRVVQKTRPGGDSVLNTYDARGNVLTSSRRPNGGTGSTDLTTTYSYTEGPTVITCVTPATCNKLHTEQDARLNTTTYVWNSNGTLQSVTRPADANGSQPQTTLAYSNFTGTDAGTISLLTGKTEKINGTTSTTTTYTRDSTNKFNVSAATVDSGTGGLNLRTCVKFDSAGNLLSISDPREVTCP